MTPNQLSSFPHLSRVIDPGRALHMRDGPIAHVLDPISLARSSRARLKGTGPMAVRDDKAALALQLDGLRRGA